MNNYLPSPFLFLPYFNEATIEHKAVLFLSLCSYCILVATIPFRILLFMFVSWFVIYVLVVFIINGFCSF